MLFDNIIFFLKTIKTTIGRTQNFMINTCWRLIFQAFLFFDVLYACFVVITLSPWCEDYSAGLNKKRKANTILQNMYSFYTWASTYILFLFVFTFYRVHSQQCACTVLNWHLKLVVYIIFVTKLLNSCMHWWYEYRRVFQSRSFSFFYLWIYLW
jgi:hypothetical protein